RAELMELAARLGADVPVFVFGHAAWAEGIGDTLSRADPPETWYCVVIPPVHVETRTIFRDRQLTRNTPMIKIRDFLAGGAGNDLEPVTRRLYREVDRAIDWLGGFAPARMTGSGAAVFAGVENLAAGQRILADMPDDFRGVVVRGVNQHPLTSLLPVCD
ncbi:MAG: 4-(cytidine 5'-diphospho)-2-C-methyl-D-erythritol kinase, partial [Proteobacteria bacterium]